MAGERVWSLAGKVLKLNSASDLEPHLEKLRASRETIEQVIVSGNTFGVEAAKLLASEIKQLKNLQVRAIPMQLLLKLTHSGTQLVDFSDIFTGRLITEIPDALSALCDALIGLPHLEEVNLSDNAFGGRSVAPMVPYLSTSHDTLRVLKLSNNGLGPEGGSVIAQALLDSANSKNTPSKLEVVQCGRNRLENGSASLWAEAFKAHGSSIREIRLYQNGIRMAGVVALANGLSHCVNLETLDLLDNTATQGNKGIDGSRAIGLGMKKWPKLKELQLSDLRLMPKGALAICSALAEGSSPQLEILKLTSDQLDATCFEQLVKAVKQHCKSLKLMELDENRCSEEDEVVIQLREALDANGCGEAMAEIEMPEEPDSVRIVSLCRQLLVSDTICSPG